MEKAAVFAIDDALERVDHDVELLQELIQIFLQEHLKGEVVMKRALEAGDATTLAHAAHALKGAAANVGAMEAARLAGLIEVSAGQHTFSDVLQLLPRLSEAVVEFRRAEESQLTAARSVK